MSRRFTRRSVAVLVASMPPTRSEPASPPHSMPKDNPHAFEISRLQAAIAGDFRSLPTAYPILARHGFMERTDNGFRSIDLGTVANRCRELIAKLEAAANGVQS